MPDGTTTARKVPLTSKGASCEQIRNPKSTHELDLLVQRVGTCLREYEELPAKRAAKRKKLMDELAALDKDEKAEAHRILSEAKRCAIKVRLYSDLHKPDLTNSNTANLPSSGSLEWRERHDQIIELIDDVFIASAKEKGHPELIRVEESPNRTAIRQNLALAKEVEGIEFGTKHSFNLKPPHTGIYLEREDDDWYVRRPGEDKAKRVPLP